MAPSPLPPLSMLPTSTYPPSSYPPTSYFDSSSVVYPALIIPAKRTGEIQKSLGDLVHREPKRKSVHPPEEGVDYTSEDAAGGGYDPRKERKLVLRRLGRAKKIYGVDEEVREMKADKVWEEEQVLSLLKSTAEDNGSGPASTAPPGKDEVRASHIRLSATPYELLTVDQALRRIMPTAEDAKNDGDDLIVEEVPSSFEIAGHIAHVNLREESLPYKYLIGKAILDKNSPRIRVVVNKVGTIENEFRTFPMEILAGEGLDVEEVERLCSGADGESSESVRVMIGPQHKSLMEAEVREHGCRFHLDFARVYFNSRLQGEHDRLVQQIIRDARRTLKGSDGDRKECVVADAMAGVGPFAVPLTSANAPHYRETRIVCHANDLNPVSYEYLVKNAKANKCFSDRLSTYNLDAREFIQNMNDENVDHFIMNLPQLGPEFLDAFRGWNFRDGDDAGEGKMGRRPMVHVHCFGEKARGPEDTARVERQVRQRCEAALGVPDCLSESSETDFRVRLVRDVGPRKNMLCVSFYLPRAVVEAEKLVLSKGEEGDTAAAKDASSARESKRDRLEGGGVADGTESQSSKRNRES